ncbi:2-oxo acid dehydrogenase subunit E2 [Pseudolysinimonas kribbensis]|uniref:dihydrolipoamide acetyltransferase family protein n=1 Tax=Pseudolysinimonas kribbensis TaxID=433641 RepID=UPI0031E014D4
MSRAFTLPDLGEGLTEAAIVRWLVAPGDEIRIDQPVVEVETAKSVVEVPSPFAGTVAEIRGAEGDVLPVGAPLLIVETAAVDPEPVRSEPVAREPVASEPAEARSAEAPDAHAAYRAEEHAGGASGNVLVGYGTSGHRSAGRRRRPRAAATTSAPADTVVAPGPVAVRSPIVRRIARESGVDLRSIPASGVDGAVTRGDVLRAASVLPPTGEVDAASGLRVRRREPLGMLRRTVAARMTRSRAEIPEATVWVDADATELWDVRRAMSTPAVPAPSLTAFLARFAILALDERPALAGRLSDDGTELIEFDGVHLGVAVNTPRGLLVPVVRDAHRLDVAGLDAEVRRVSATAREGTASPHELTGSTFTLNNYGSLGVDGSAAIINHPEVALLGVGRALERPWVVDGAIVPRRILQLSLVFDHRVCDGGYAAGFLRAVVDAIEKPVALLARL